MAKCMRPLLGTSVINFKRCSMHYHVRNQFVARHKEVASRVAGTHRVWLGRGFDVRLRLRPYFFMHIAKT
jgi:hypothetical protein